MLPFPRLYTPRLILRKIEVDDIPLLVKHANNKKISDYVLNIPHPYHEPDAVFRISYVVQGFKSKARYVFAIILKDSEEFIGEIGLHLDTAKPIAQLGYWIGAPFWNRGLATEATAAVLKFAFGTLALQQVFATCHVDNPASAHVLLHNGMAHAGTTGNVAQYVLTAERYSTPGI